MGPTTLTRASIKYPPNDETTFQTNVFAAHICKLRCTFTTVRKITIIIIVILLLSRFKLSESSIVTKETTVQRYIYICIFILLFFKELQRSSLAWAVIRRNTAKLVLSTCTVLCRNAPERLTFARVKRRGKRPILIFHKCLYIGRYATFIEHLV